MKYLFFSLLMANLALANYDYLLYTTFWPPSITDEKLPYQVDYFTIHGIWPQYSNNTWPQYCNNSQPFNASVIAEFKYLLKYIWYDYNHQDPDLFWKHEWDKHGTCAEPYIPDEYDYFKQAIVWHSKYRILDVLKSFNIKPNNTYYAKQLMEDSLHYKFGHKVKLICEKNILKNVELCFNKQLQMIDCYEDSECPNEIFFKKLNN